MRTMLIRELATVARCSVPAGISQLALPGGLPVGPNMASKKQPTARRRGVNSDGTDDGGQTQGDVGTGPSAALAYLSHKLVPNGVKLAIVVLRADLIPWTG